MIKIDAGSKLERKISSRVFYAYLETNDIVEFNKRIVELSNELDLDEGHLKRLRNVYYRNYASPVEKARHDEKAAMYSSKTPEYVSFCNSLFQLPENERLEYASSVRYSSFYVKEFLKKYKERGGKYSDLVDDFYKKYSIFVQKRNKSVLEDKKDLSFYEACSFYDELVEFGFSNVQDYIQNFIDEFKDFRKIESKCSSYRKFISDFNTDLMDQYVIDMEKNREKTYYFMKERIDYFMERAKNTVQGFDNVDIIDYYMTMGMPLNSFKKLCRGYVNISTFNIIFEPYFKMEQGLVDDPKIDCNYVFNGEVVSLNDKTKVLNFLYQYNIPFVYFNIALKKYFDGGLNQYIDSEKQKTLSNK